MIDSIIVDIQDYNDTPLVPWIARLGQVQTYTKGAVVLMAITAAAGSVTPAMATTPDNWDWDSGSRQEEADAPKGGTKPSKIARESTFDYKTGRQAPVTENNRHPSGHQEEQLLVDQEVPQAETPAPDATTGQVIDGDWRATRQSPAERALEQNPGVEKDCDGNVYTGNEVYQQAELDESGNLTARGREQMGIGNGNSFCQQNPGDPNCKLDASGDAG